MIISTLEDSRYREFLRAKDRYVRILRLRAQGKNDLEIREIEGLSRQRISQLNQAIKKAQIRGWL